MATVVAGLVACSDERQAEVNTVQQEHQLEYGDAATQRVRNNRVFELLGNSNAKVSGLSDEEICSVFRSLVGKPIAYYDDPSQPSIHDYAMELLRRQIFRLGQSRDEVERLLGVDTLAQSKVRFATCEVSEIIAHFDEADLVKLIEYEKEGEAPKGTFQITLDGKGYVW